MTQVKRTRNPALKRGLSALFEDAKANGNSAGQRQESPADELPIDLLDPNPFQPRRAFDEAALAELADSISRNGVIQPVLVRPSAESSDRYQIIAGERRWRAAQRAGVHQVPVRVLELDDQSALQFALIENLQRVDLNPIEEARGYRRLVEDFGHGHEDLAGVVGRSRSHLTNTMRLLQLPKAVQEMLERGELSMGHARPLVGHPRATELARRIVDRALSTRDAERLAKGGAAAARRRSDPAPRDPDTAELEESLGAAVGSRVRINDKHGRGEVLISYKSYEELDRISSRLTGVELP